MRMTSRLVAVLAAAGAVLAVRDARAVGTRTFELDSLDKLSGGDLAGVSVGSDGVVRAGMTLGAVALPTDTGNTVACAVALADGSILVGTGPAHGGKVVRIAGGVATEYADTKESAVDGLAVDRAGNVYAATEDAGSVVRVEPGGKTSVYYRTDDPFVIAVAVADDGAVYAGTGGGKALLYRITGPGRATVVHDFRG